MRACYMDMCVCVCVCISNFCSDYRFVFSEETLQSIPAASSMMSLYN